MEEKDIYTYTHGWSLGGGVGLGVVGGVVGLGVLSQVVGVSVDGR